jgi:hypothetical protein
LKPGVRSIRVENGKAVGQVTHQGVCDADLAVSNAGIKQTLEMAGEDQFPTFPLSLAKKRRGALGAVTIQYARDRRPFEIVVGVGVSLPGLLIADAQSPLGDDDARSMGEVVDDASLRDPPWVRGTYP